MADNQLVEPLSNKGVDPTLADPIENGNNLLEGKNKEHEIEQKIKHEEIEREDEFEDSLEELPINGEGDRQVRDRKQPLPRPPSQPKIKLPNLPVHTFSARKKEDVTVFFDQLENIADIYGWSDSLILETVLASLKV